MQQSMDTCPTGDGVLETGSSSTGSDLPELDKILIGKKESEVLLRRMLETQRQYGR